MSLSFFSGQSACCVTSQALCLLLHFYLCRCCFRGLPGQGRGVAPSHAFTLTSACIYAVVSGIKVSVVTCLFPHQALTNYSVLVCSLCFVSSACFSPPTLSTIQIRVFNLDCQLMFLGICPAIVTCERYPLHNSYFEWKR